MAVEEAFLAGFNTAKSMPGLDYCDAATLLRVSELARSTSKRARDEIRRILPACVGERGKDAIRADLAEAEMRREARGRRFGRQVAAPGVVGDATVDEGGEPLPRAILAGSP